MTRCGQRRAQARCRVADAKQEVMPPAECAPDISSDALYRWALRCHDADAARHEHLAGAFITQRRAYSRSPPVSASRHRISRLTSRSPEHAEKDGACRCTEDAPPARPMRTSRHSMMPRDPARRAERRCYSAMIFGAERQGGHTPLAISRAHKMPPRGSLLSLRLAAGRHWAGRISARFTMIPDAACRPGTRSAILEHNTGGSFSFQCQNTDYIVCHTRRFLR